MPANTSPTTDFTPERLLRLSAVEEIVGAKKSWIYEEIREGRFPRPRKLSPYSRRRGWLLSDIQGWILSRQAA